MRMHIVLGKQFPFVLLFLCVSLLLVQWQIKHVIYIRNRNMHFNGLVRFRVFLRFFFHGFYNSHRSLMVCAYGRDEQKKNQFTTIIKQWAHDIYYNQIAGESAEG